MEQGAIFCGFLTIVAAAAVALPLFVDPPSLPAVDETQFTQLGYHVERTSIGEVRSMTYGPMTAVLWVNGCRVEVEWRGGERRGQPSRWVVTKPSLPPSIGRSQPEELTTAHVHRMRLRGHPCLNEKTPKHVLRAPGSKDPS
jgi:hypothetical protein